MMRVHDNHESTAAVAARALSYRFGGDVWDYVAAVESGAIVSERLRPLFVVYGIILGSLPQTSSAEFRLSPDDRNWDIGRWTPTTPTTAARGGGTQEWLSALLADARVALRMILPLAETEQEFIRQLQLGCMRPELLTQEPNLQDAIRHQPYLHKFAANSTKQARR